MTESLPHLVLGPLSAADADLPAVTDTTDGRTVTFGELRALVDAAATEITARLAETDTGTGTDTRTRPVVGLNAPNGLPFIVGFFASLAAGAAVTPLGAQASRAEIAGQLNRVDARLLLTTTDAGRAAAGDLHIAALDPAQLTAATAASQPTATTAHGAETATGCDEASAIEGAACLPFSSGTTGTPKPVVLTHANLVANVRQMSAALDACGMRRDWPIAAPLPFAHVYGLTVLMCTTLYRRNHLVVLDGFDPATFLRLHQQHNVAWSYVAPAILARLAADGVPEGVDLSALRVVLSGADTLSAELAARAAGVLGCEVIQGYGLTEAAPVTHVNVRGVDDPATLGTPVEDTDVRVMRAGHEVLSPGEAGEMWVRGPQVTCGYLGMPEATAEALVDGWLRTGDVVRLGAGSVRAGRMTGRDLTVIGRAKEIINHNGFSVSPAEVEERLRAHPMLADAAVAAWRRPGRGEAPRAVVVLADAASHPAGAELSARLRDWVGAELADYKVPVRFDVADAVPRTATGKVARTRLSEGWDSEG
ncbi:AMP-binding protein [Corynebacterium frankenforstense]|uniref:class I adenylate-forming enzyme family protein n=1 Tax=Corynebacterium frankenforstense TaxID=1230998 RepID=UPI002551C48C|nr:AMP-binding protein [Corynebacterium frankenforstense]MDK6259381.1 AMP-binding protein [Corynebacterium frankenforstense]